MRLEGIEIQNFKALRSVDLKDLPGLMVLVGANGSGKTTFFDVFRFLRDALAGNVRQALDARGGFEEVVTRGCERQSIRIELDVSLDLEVLIYGIEIGKPDSRPVVLHEFLRDKTGRHELLDFRSGSGFAIRDGPLGDQKEQQQLDSQDIVAIKGLGQFKQFRVASALRNFLERWHLSDFQVSAARERNRSSDSSEHLSESGDNLARHAEYVRVNHPAIFETILQRLRRRVPGMNEIRPETTEDGFLMLRFLEGQRKTAFLERRVSDGTIKMFAYLLLLHDAEPHPLLCIEEPENQLYPSLMGELVEEFRDYSRRGSVMVSTHSPDLLNAARLEEVFWLAKRDGFSEVVRAQNDPQVRRYMEEGDQMGHLWKQGFFAGADPV